MNKINKFIVMSGLVLGFLPILSYADSDQPAGDTGYCGGSTHQVCTQHIYNRSNAAWTVKFYSQTGGDTGHEVYTVQPHTYVPLLYCADIFDATDETVNVIDSNGKFISTETSSGGNHCPHAYTNGSSDNVQFNQHPVDLNNPVTDKNVAGSDGDIIIWPDNL